MTVGSNSDPSCKSLGIPGSVTEINEWEFQDPKLEVPTIYKTNVRPIYIREYNHQNMALQYGTTPPV